MSLKTRKWKTCNSKFVFCAKSNDFDDKIDDYILRRLYANDQFYKLFMDYKGCYSSYFEWKYVKNDVVYVRYLNYGMPTEYHMYKLTEDDDFCVNTDQLFDATSDLYDDVDAWESAKVNKDDYERQVHSEPEKKISYVLFRALMRFKAKYLFGDYSDGFINTEKNDDYVSIALWFIQQSESVFLFTNNCLSPVRVPTGHLQEILATNLDVGDVANNKD